MSRNKSFLFLLTAVVLLLCNLVYADQKDIDEAISKIMFIDSTYEKIKIDNFTEVVPYLHQIRNSEGLDAAIHLWNFGYLEPLELAWWKTKYKTTRLIVLILYYGTYIDTDISFFPKFREYTERYNKYEAAIRIEEIDYVEKNITLIKGKLRIFQNEVTP